MNPSSEASEKLPELSSEVAKTPETSSSESQVVTAPGERPPSYVKLAMRNMVRKGRQSLVHFFLTSVGLIAVLVGLAYLTR